MSDLTAIDTNVVIALLEREPSVVERFDSAKRLALPAIVLGELYFGALRSARASENLARLDRLVLRVSIGFCDRGTAMEYGLIRRDLARIGRPIPDNDVWIAAMCRQFHMTLVTRDEHFGFVSGLQLQRW